MKKINEHIIYKTLNTLILEQEETESDNESFSPFSPEEEKFLGVFDTTRSKQVGVIYSISEIGIREFLARSGKSLNCTSSVLLKLLKDNIIKIVPYTGYGSNTDYTIELQLSLDDVSGLGEEADTGGDAAAAGGEDTPAEAPGEAIGGAETPPPDLEGPPMEWVVNYKDIINESVNIAKKLITEKKSKKKRKVKLDDKIKIYTSQSRILQRLPSEFIHQLKRVIKIMSRKTYNKLDQERLIADILDTVKHNFDLTDKQIRRAFEFHKNQKRLQKYLDK